MHDSREIDAADLQPSLTRDDAGDVEQIADELDLELCAALDRVESLLAPCRVEAAFLQERDPREDRAERRPQLVRERREKLILGAIRAFCGLTQRLLARERLAQRLLRVTHPQQCSHGRHQHGGIDGLRQAGVGASFERLHRVAFLDVRGGHLQHERRLDSALLQLLADFPSVRVGELGVEHDDIGRVRVDEDERLGAGPGLEDLEARVSQGPALGVAIGGGVVDDDDANGRCTHGRGPLSPRMAASMVASAIAREMPFFGSKPAAGRKRPRSSSSIGCAVTITIGMSQVAGSAFRRRNTS